MNYPSYFLKLEEYVTELFSENANESLVYHNIVHTQNVVQRCIEIASNYKIDRVDQAVLYTAAWFHDTGHLFGEMADHEVKSVEALLEYETRNTIEQDELLQIMQCILSTKMPQSPKNLLENILCDADLYHLGTPEFGMIDLLVKKETEIRKKMIIDDHKWLEHSLNLLEGHHYTTEYCQNRLMQGKRINIAWLKKKLEGDVRG